MAALTQSYVHGASAAPLIGETIGALLERVTAEGPDRPALVTRHQSVRWTYAELNRRVDDLAAGLLALGLEPGDRVGIWSPNNSEWVLAQFATAKAGLILVNINPAYRSHEAEYALTKVGCKALILSPGFKSNDYFASSARSGARDRLRRARRPVGAGLPQLETVIRLGAREDAGHAEFRRRRRAGDRRRSVPRSPPWRSGCSSTIRSTSNSPPARPARRRARR